MRVITKKKGNKDYYYLQHSYRKGKKVITKEKYLGMEIPKNVDEIKGEFSRELKKDLYKKKEKVSHELLLEWHKEIFGETKPDIAGKYRNYLVRVGSYIAPHWNEIKPTMSQIIEFVNKSKLNPVELAARAHYTFESIHPFGDGNGRIGRLLMNHILWHAGYPMLIIEYKKRKSYYDAFPKGQEAFVEYFLKRYLAVHKKRYTK